MIGTIGSILLLAQVAAARPDCGAKLYHNVIVKTESFVLKSVQPKFVSESLRGSDNACVRLEFFISSTGRAVDIRVAQTSGYRSLDVAAIKALKQYCFRQQKKYTKSLFMLVFRPRSESG